MHPSPMHNDTDEGDDEVQKNIDDDESEKNVDLQKDIMQVAAQVFEEYTIKGQFLKLIWERSFFRINYLEDFLFWKSPQENAAINNSTK